MPTVREYMDDDPATVTPDTSAEDVARLLGTHELHGVPVVNEADRCIGIITENDLVMADNRLGDLCLHCAIIATKAVAGGLNLGIDSGNRCRSHKFSSF